MQKDMSGSSQLWFYSREGERYGPVTFDELKVLAEHGEINPRLDLAWKSGMPSWIPCGEVKALFPKAEPQAAAKAVAASGAASKSSASGNLHTSMSGAADWPGFRRRGFIFLTLVLPILVGVAFGLLEKHVTALLGPQMAKHAPLGLGIFLTLLTVLVVVNRFRNLGMSMLWIVGWFIPLINLWLGHRVFACPAGYAYHKQMDGIGIFLALIYWLLVLINIIVIGVLVAVALGAIGDPAMTKEIQDLLKQGLQQSSALPSSAPVPPAP